MACDDHNLDELNASDDAPANDDTLGDATETLGGRCVAFVGKLGGVNRREAAAIVRQHGGTPVDPAHGELLVLGADEFPLGEDELVDAEMRERAARGEIEIISETQFWYRLGMVESDQHVRRLYTPSMLAQLLGTPVSVIRRWHRRGLIVPVRTVHRLPYFDFQEVATARRLADMLLKGATPASIEKQLEQLARLVPDVERPLAQLSVIVEGRELLLRKGAGLIEPGGQMRLDFDRQFTDVGDHDSRTGTDHATAGAATDASDNTPAVIPSASLFGREVSDLPPPHELVQQASELEDLGRIHDAIEMYRVSLVAGGPRAEVCFRLAELLYLNGDVSAARERYSMAVELDEDYVEARANLGCVLAELGEAELAIAAFYGTLRSHPDYPDVHYHLARMLDERDQSEEAVEHWQRFLELTPDSPWADEARARLEPLDE